MFIPKTWVNSGETGALPISTKDMSRIENAVAGAVGKEINTQYLMKRNTVNISSAMVGDGWTGGTYVGGSGTVSADTTNFLTGVGAVKCTVSSNLGGMYMNKTMDLTKYDCQKGASEDDYIRFSIYIADIADLSSSAIAIMFRNSSNPSLNYAWSYLTQSNFYDGWNHLHIKISDFWIVGTFDWALTTGVSFFTYPGGSEGIEFTLECLELCRYGSKDDIYNISFGGMEQYIGTRVTDIKYNKNTTDLLSSTYVRSGESKRASSKIWCNYSGADSCLKVFSTNTQSTGEFQVCEDFYMEDGCVYEIVFKAIGAVTNRYRINSYDFWQSDKPRYIEFYFDAGLKCRIVKNNIYDVTVSSNNVTFSVVSGHVYTLKIYRDNNYYTCVLWDNADTKIVDTVGGMLETKDKENWSSDTYYSYPYDDVFKPFLELRAYGNSHRSDTIYSIKQYKV